MSAPKTTVPTSERVYSSYSRVRLHGLTERETRRFVELHPASRRLHQRALKSLVSGVPMPWMARWAGGFPIYAAHAAGARITDVDGHSYLAFFPRDRGA